MIESFLCFISKKKTKNVAQLTAKKKKKKNSLECKFYSQINEKTRYKNQRSRVEEFDQSIHTRIQRDIVVVKQRREVRKSIRRVLGGGLTDSANGTSRFSFRLTISIVL